MKNKIRENVAQSQLSEFALFYPFKQLLYNYSYVHRHMQTKLMQKITMQRQGMFASTFVI